MADVTATYRNGSTAQLANIYLRGTQIKFMILPEMLKNAPMLKVSITWHYYVFVNILFRLPSRRLLNKATFGRLVAVAVVAAVEAEALAWAAHLAGSKSTSFLVLKSWNLFWFRLNKKTALINLWLRWDGKNCLTEKLSKPFGYIVIAKTKLIVTHVSNLVFVGSPKN